jgi:hypothetical protein
MGQLNLRGVDDELIRLVKARAATEGMTIPQYVCGALERDLKQGWTPLQKSQQEPVQVRIQRAAQNAPNQEAKETVYERDEYSQ